MKRRNYMSYIENLDQPSHNHSLSDNIERFSIGNLEILSEPESSLEQTFIVPRLFDLVHMISTSVRHKSIFNTSSGTLVECMSGIYIIFF